MDMSHPTPEPTSSERTVNSERYDAVIALGEKIVAELGLADSNDLLSRWMAHYVAEKIENAKAAASNQNDKERECCELILKLWQHRTWFLEGKRPFRDFEPALKVLAGLAPSASPRIYFASGWLSEPEEALISASRDWLRIVAGIDSVATAIITYCVKMAIKDVEEKSREWVAVAEEAGADQGSDIEAARGLLEIDITFVGADKKSTREQRLLKQLDAFAQVSAELRRTLERSSTDNKREEKPSRKSQKKKGPKRKRPRERGHPDPLSAQTLIRPTGARPRCSIGRSLPVACNPRWVDAKFVLMEKGMIDRIWAEAFAEGWIAGWNAHDLERVLAHYSDDFEMTSPLIVERMGVANGKLKGKEAVRSYWGQGLAATPQLHFNLLDVIIGVNALAIVYESITASRTVIEYIEFDDQRRAVRAEALYGQRPTA